MTQAPECAKKKKKGIELRKCVFCSTSWQVYFRRMKLQFQLFVLFLILKMGFLKHKEDNQDCHREHSVKDMFLTFKTAGVQLFEQQAFCLHRRTFKIQRSFSKSDRDANETVNQAKINKLNLDLKYSNSLNIKRNKTQSYFNRSGCYSYHKHFQWKACCYLFGA